MYVFVHISCLFVSLNCNYKIERIVKRFDLLQMCYVQLCHTVYISDLHTALQGLITHQIFVYISLLVVKK